MNKQNGFGFIDIMMVTAIVGIITAMTLIAFKQDAIDRKMLSNEEIIAETKKCNEAGLGTHFVENITRNGIKLIYCVPKN